LAAKVVVPAVTPLVAYVMYVGAAELMVAKSVRVESLAGIEPLFVTVTSYSALAPGYARSTSNVADVASNAGAEFSVAPVAEVCVMLVMATSQSPEAVPEPLTLRTCVYAAYATEANPTSTTAPMISLFLMNTFLYFIYTQIL
jgi:hypothetical protein